MRDDLIGQLAEILCICRRRGWPALTAIVVNRNADGLDGAALEGFAESARKAGYEVGDPREFADEQKGAVFATAQAAPEVLDLGEGAFLEDPVADSGEGADSTEASEEPHAAKPSLETRVTAVETKVEGLQENAGALREDLRGFRAETSVNFNRLEDKVDANHRERMSKIDSSHRECMNKIDRSNSDLLNKIDRSNSDLLNKIDRSRRELLKKLDSNHAEVLKKFDERYGKFFDRQLLVDLAIIGAIVTIIVSAMGMLSP